MRKLLEIFILAGLASYMYSQNQDLVAIIAILLLVLTLALLIAFMPVGWFGIAGSVGLLGLRALHPATTMFAPLATYGLYQRDPRLTILPLLMALIEPSMEGIILNGLALWLAHHEKGSRTRIGNYYSLQDKFRENEFLQRKILTEQGLNHEKNLEIAVLKERNRISRELHDSIGHTLSASLLQMEAMKITAPEELKPRIEQIRNALSEGMQDIRTSLHGLHDASFSLKAEIEKVMAPLSPKFRVRLDYQLDEPDIEIKRCMLQMIRESLTNVGKHSDGDTVDVLLRELPKHYTVTVKDNGSQKAKGQGMGLIGMEETARTLGGLLSYGWSQGFFVHLNLPKEENNESNNHR